MIFGPRASYESDRTRVVLACRAAVAKRDFHTAWNLADAASKAAHRLTKAEYRWNTRFCLWEHPDDDGINCRAQRLGERRHAAIDAASEAARLLDDLWHQLSCGLIRR